MLAGAGWGLSRLRPVLAWIGKDDVLAIQSPDDLGPILNFVSHHPSQRLVLLDQWPGDEGKRYVAWLRERQPAIDVTRLPRPLENPTDYRAIYVSVRATLATLRGGGESDGVRVLVNPGTPQMQTVWLLAAAGSEGVELISVDRTGRVELVDAPFLIAADFIPAAKVWGGGRDGYEHPREVVAESPAMREVLRRAFRVARVSVSVLIQGETGTGKEVVAQYVHRSSGRSGPFIPVNCGALHQGLVESELFGHEKGAFTGAIRRKDGAVQQADGGLLFLDEIGELDPAAQVKLLRVLQEREVVRVGGERVERFDVRVVAATHRDLARDVAEGRFREDLYYRLADVTLTIPPLRQRKEDLRKLVAVFATQIAKEFAGKTEFAGFSLSPGAIDALLTYGWPGNIRQLRAVMMRLALWARRQPVTELDVATEIGGLPASSSEPKVVTNLEAHLDDIRRVQIELALREAGGNQTRAFRRLGYGNLTTFRNHCIRLGMHPGGRTKTSDD